MERSVPKRRHIKFRRQVINPQKKNSQHGEPLKYICFVTGYIRLSLDIPSKKL